jgi:hypothetical protein
MWTWGELVTGKRVSHPSVFERYTEATRRAIYFARLEALRRGESIITVADLLAGLSVDEDTRAERVGSLKANASYLRWLLALPALPAFTAGAVASSNPDLALSLEENRAQLDDEAKRALAYTILEADRDRNYWIDSDHLLRGLLRFPNKADFALLKTEINLRSARKASTRDREEHLPEENPNLKVVQYLVRKWVALLVPPILSLACYLYILLEGIGLTTSPIAR